MLPVYLSFKEIQRNKLRFLSFCAVIALITFLVLFIAALGEGLATAGKQYIESIEAELIVFQNEVDLSIPSSRLSRATLNDIERVEGVAAVGPIGFSNASIVLGNGSAEENIDVALIGVEPGMPGAPAVFAGQPLRSRRAKEIVIDQNVLNSVNIPVGSTLTLKVIQGTEEKLYALKVVGQTAGAQYSFLPGVFVPLQTWDQIRPQGAANSADLTFNVAAVKLQDATAWEAMIPILQQQVRNVEVTDPITTYKSGPGYSAQQSTVNTQKFFTLLIAVLVIGGFFQIQTLQKVGQIGMLKAIGASNWLVSLTLIAQVILVTLLGTALGTAASLLVGQLLPAGIPIVFNGSAVLFSVVTLLLIGPLGGLLSVRTLFKVEPLTALGLGN